MAGPTVEVPATWRPPYERSWIDAMTERIAALPVPEGVVYIALAIGAATILTLAQWAAGGYPVGTVRPTQLLLGLAAGAFPWLVRRFNLRAARAFEALDPLLIVDTDQRADLEFRLTNLPRTPTLVVGLAIVVLSLTRFATSQPRAQALFLTSQTITAAISLVVLVGLAFVGSAIIAKSVYQAWMIHRITTRDIRIGLFEIARLYGFSTLTGMMAATLVVSGLLFSLTEPTLVSAFDPIAFGSLAFGLTLALAVFALPLVGVHNRLVAEKERLRSITRQSIGIATTELHRVVAANELPAMDPLNKAITSLDIEYRSINDAPTWPWRSDTFRWVIGVLMIPFALFLLQQVVPRLLS